MNSFNFKDNLNDFKSSISILKEKIGKVLRMCDNTDFKQEEAFDILQDGLIDLVDIKHINSKIQKEIEHFKEATTVEREKVERKNLNFQSFLYQKENINSQINLCINFPTVEMDKINFTNETSVIEFYKDRYGKFISRNELTRMDYLKFELENRIELNEKLDKLQQDKEENSRKLKERENLINVLPGYLSNLENSTLKSQSFLNLNISSRRKFTELSEKLPLPLYVLYNSLNYIDSYEYNYEVKILGDENLVSDFYLKYPNRSNFGDTYSDKPAKEEGEHSLDEGEINDDVSNFSDKTLGVKGKGSKVDSKKGALDMLNIQKLTKFPLHLQLVMRPCEHSLDKDNGFPVHVNFYYLPIVNIVTVEASCSNADFNTSKLMSNILRSPINFLPQHKTDIQSALGFLCNELKPNEKFYDYIQVLSNNPSYNLNIIHKVVEAFQKNKNKVNTFPKRTLYDDEVTKISTENFSHLLCERVKNLPFLFLQLNYLSKFKQIHPKSEVSKEKRFKFLNETTFISNFIQINQEDFLNVLSESLNDEDRDYLITSKFEKDEEGNFVRKFYKVPYTIYSQDEAVYFNLQIQCKDKRYSCHIEIGYDYPLTNPRFIVNQEEEKFSPNVPSTLLHLVDEKSRKNLVPNRNESIMREIENEVNQFYYEFCPEDKREWLLSYQIRNVLMCLDILNDKADYLAKGTKPTFVYDENSNKFKIR